MPVPRPLAAATTFLQKLSMKRLVVGAANRFGIEALCLVTLAVGLIAFSIAITVVVEQLFAFARTKGWM